MKTPSVYMSECNMTQGIAFVLLHYGQYETSLRCTENLLEKLEGNYHIIIIDNASPDGSGLRLRKRFQEEQRVEVILLNQNIGFTGGMNKGYRIAKEQGYRFIALINNDTLVLSEHICNTIWKDYEQYGFGVLGPHIETPDGINGFNSNPYHGIEADDSQMAKYLERSIQEMERWIKLDDLHLATTKKKIEHWKACLKKQIKKILRKQQRKDNTMEVVRNRAKEREQFAFDSGLHGSYLILGPAFVENFEGLEPVTFLYGEEWLLYRRCRMEGLPMIYDPNIRIWHDEHAVQKIQTGSEVKKMINRWRIERESHRQILRYIEKEHLAGRIFDIK